MNDILFLPIDEVADLIKSRRLSPVELVQATLEHIEATDHQLNAFPVVKGEEAMVAAKKAEEEIASGKYRGPFHGLPVGFKDNIAVNGWVTTCGSPILKDNITHYDAAVVTRLRNAGAIVVGKNNMHEWALAGSCTYSCFGTVHNPWNTDYIAGGSSGGSAAAVSAGQAFLSVGTDARASIRNPASYCGVTGLKPSTGLVSRYGELPSTSAWYMVIGPIARTVRDLAFAMDVLAGEDARDPNSLSSGRSSYIDSIDGKVQDLRFGVVSNYFFDDATPEIERAVRHAAMTFADMGAVVEEVEIPGLEDMQLIEPSFESENKSWLLDLALHRGDEFLHQDIRFRILAGAFARVIDHDRASRLLNRLRWTVQKTFESIDVLITPTNSSTAYPIEATTLDLKSGRIDVQSANGQSRATTRLTVPFNALGLPAVSIPCGYGENGLPIGLQLVGNHLEDALVLKAGLAFESATDFGYIKPPVIR